MGVAGLGPRRPRLALPYGLLALSSAGLPGLRHDSMSNLAEAYCETKLPMLEYAPLESTTCTCHVRACPPGLNETWICVEVDEMTDS